jgi:sulfur transfer protein SufE
MLYHQNHDMLGIEEAAEQAKQSMQQDLKLVTQLEEKYRQDLLQSKRNMAQFREDIEAQKQEVHDAVEHLVQKMTEHKVAMIQALDKTLQERLSSNKNAE